MTNANFKHIFVFIMTEYCELYGKEDNISSSLSEESDKDVSEDDEVSDGRSASSEDEVAGHTDL